MLSAVRGVDREPDVLGRRRGPARRRRDLHCEHPGARLRHHPHLDRRDAARLPHPRRVAEPAQTRYANNSEAEPERVERPRTRRRAPSLAFKCLVPPRPLKRMLNAPSLALSRPVFRSAPSTVSPPYLPTLPPGPPPRPLRLYWLSMRRLGRSRDGRAGDGDDGGVRDQDLPQPLHARDGPAPRVARHRQQRLLRPGPRRHLLLHRHFELWPGQVVGRRAGTPLRAPSTQPAPAPILPRPAPGRTRSGTR